MTLKNRPVARTQMLIRRPVAEVFEAFVDPAVTTRFWFTHSTGRVEPGKTLRWDWAMYGASAEVAVEEVEPNRRIRIAWGSPPSPVEWQFATRPDGTLVQIASWGSTGDDDEAVAKALDSMGGFTFVLAGLKALLEHGVELNLTADHHPDANVARDS